MRPPLRPLKTSPLFSRRRLALIGVALAILGLSAWRISISIQREREQSAKERAAKLAEEFEDARGSSSVRIFLDPTLIKMLADDPKSVQSLNTLDLSMIDFRDQNMTAAQKLSNVRRITAYSCHDVEKLLSAMKGSPAIEELYFDSILLSDAGVETLATFPNLREVHFSYVSTQERIDLLRSTLPSVDVVISEGPEAKD